MKKILCATDGTVHGDKAVVHAAHLAKVENVPLEICTVNVLTGGMRGAAIYAHSDREVSRTLGAAVVLAKAEGAQNVSTVELDAREIASSVVAYANKEGFDHIVTGTGDPRGIKRLVLGSVAASIAASADCPVTIAR